MTTQEQDIAAQVRIQTLRIVGVCFIVGVALLALFASMVTASWQMGACASMCGHSGVRKFSLAKHGMDEEIPGCECAGEPPREMSR